MNAAEKLLYAVKQGKHICVGLDSDINKIPEHLFSAEDPIFEFNKRIIEATADYAAAYKLNFAFYESLGIKGLNSLIKTLRILPRELLVIADAKRGDIGNTSVKYAQAIYEHFQFDSATLNPYMGYDSVEAFKVYREKLSFILSLTSNPSAGDFEQLKLADGGYLFQEVIRRVGKWNEYGNLGIVFGATNIDALAENFDLFKELPVLLPGVGAQGGDLKSISSLFYERNKKDYMVNISRSLIFADNTVNFQLKVREKIIEFNKQVIC